MMERQHIIELHTILSSRFSLDEFQTLCLYLGVNYDALPEGGIESKARGLIERFERREQLSRLVEAGKRLRPDISWPDTPEAVQEPSSTFSSERNPTWSSGRPMPWGWIAGAGLGAVALVVIVLLLTQGAGGKGQPGLLPTSTMMTEVAVPIVSTDTPDQPTSQPINTSTLTATPGLVAGSPVTSERDSMVMVYVPGGTFQMGSDDDAVDYALQLCKEFRNDCTRDWINEQPTHTVKLDSFWIDKYEVTNAQYALCVTDGDCIKLTTCSREESAYEDIKKDDYPVVCMDWYMAEAYCKWARRRLPTEAEWEYAARGPNRNTYPWGSIFDGTLLNFCDINCIRDWKIADDDGYKRAAPVGSFKDGASWCGALDMAGNVWEWTSDWYGNYSSLPQKNPAGPETGDVKIVRGGSWDSPVFWIRSAHRSGILPDSGDDNLGFRCAADYAP